MPFEQNEHGFQVRSLLLNLSLVWIWIKRHGFGDKPTFAQVFLYMALDNQPTFVRSN